MSLILINKEFTDIFGDSLTFYRNNAGDKTSVEFTLDNAIRTRSGQNLQITAALSPNEFVRSVGNWIDDGWRVGDTYSMVLFQQNGVPYPGYPLTGTVLYISGTVMGVTNIPAGMTNGETYGSLTPLQFTATRYHDGLDVLVNHVQNGTTGFPQSLIDGENTVLRFEGLDALTVTDTLAGTQVGFMSGAFAVENIELTYVSVSNGLRRYKITFDTYNPGIYSDQWFLGANTLKLFTEFKFQSVIGEPYGTQNLVFNEDGDTGYLDQPYNTGAAPDATLLQGFSTLDWANATTANIVINLNVPGVTNFYVGGGYYSIDENYYKNKPESQTYLTMQLQAYTPLAPAIYGSAYGPNSAYWNLVVSPPVIVGSQRTYTLVMQPSAQFQALMNSRPDGDRRFVIYMKAGNVNLTLFDGQLTKVAPPNGVIPNIDTNTIIRHDDNSTDANGIDLPIPLGFHRLYTEDDAAWVLKFRPRKGDVYTALRVNVSAFNTVTGENFLLQQSTFDLSGVPISADDRQLINLQAAQANNLPTTSAKRTATLELYPAIDTLTTYGWKLYYPFIPLWQYWEALAGVNAAFWPNQNKNWFAYDDATDWAVRLSCEIDDDQGRYNAVNRFVIQDYDSGNTTPVHKYFRPNGVQVTSLVEGELMTIKAEHTTAAGLTPSSIWGAITVETFEGAPRWLTSSVIAPDGNPNNPLGPLSISVSGTTTTLECTLDTNLIDLTNGVSITSRIFGNDIRVDKWLLTSGDYWQQGGTTDEWIIQ
jgi:hypothetical protein